MLLNRQPWSRVAKHTLTIWCLLMAGTALSAHAKPTDDASTQSQTLMLGVVMNGHTTDAIAAFHLFPNGRLAATPGDLQTAGFKVQSIKPGPDGLINLDSLPGVKWRYDEPHQLIDFSAQDSVRIPNTIDLGSRGKPIDFSHVQSDFGLVVNYSLYGASGWGGGSRRAFSGAFDARLLSPYGITSTSALGKFDALVDKTRDFSNGFTRLDSTWRYTDPKHALVYQLGDGVSGSLPWSSSWRFGGIQFRRNFGVRPDLITAPVPNLSGSAALPSTLDLYLNNIKVFSGAVPAGPFDFSGLPFVNSDGQANIVMRDALGREVRVQRSYYYTPDMIGKGVLDFSTELGFPRLDYGENSFEYDQNFAGSASVRYGLTNWLTVDGHFEATKGLVNGGAGLISSLGSFGALGESLAASRYSDPQGTETGFKTSINYQTGYNGYMFYMGTTRSFGDYYDIGLAVDRHNGAITPMSARARSIDTVGVSLPLLFDPSSIGVNYSRVRGKDKDNDASILNASWSRTIFKKVSMFATGYANLDKQRNYGAFVGLSVPIGDNMTASIDASNDSVVTSLSKSSRLGEDPISWSLRDREGRKGQSSRSATADYRAPVGQFSGSLDQSGDMGRVTATVDGALVIAGNDIFFVNQSDDGFAIVKGGGPHAQVSLNGRHVTNTNSRGNAFVPDLQSYQDNTVSIDPTNIPVDLQPESTQAIIVPADRSGAVIDFGTKKLSAANVVLLNTKGQPVPMGSEVVLDGDSKISVMGYDGRVWITGLSPKNSVTVTQPDGLGTCRASFTYKPVTGAITEIPGVLCQ
ncbi:fimbria/pilus outer membrane usher protein [Brucella sp. 21LCYQ03]|nr:fimbria/pilus outer membrane usher protein [Brucella sp. 21LCYQ03]